MVNLNGTILDQNEVNITLENRGYKYGDALFETLKVVHSKIFFWEDHYFRLMASMRILRMEIPMEFTMEFLEQEIIKTISVNGLAKSAARVRLNIDRGEGGKYTPITKKINYSIVVDELENEFYTIDTKPYTVDLFKDYYMSPGLLSAIKTNNKIINVLGSIYAQENSFENCLLLNTNKNVVEALNGNLFLVKGKTIKTPPLEDGCLKGIMRKQLIEIIAKLEDYELLEASISPFELQKADELFTTNVITGIQPITNYRKKSFTADVATLLVEKLNIKVRLS
ncbi:aminotransferase class IV [Gaetbulibacter sp. NE]|uniref:aminotransferase class IV n=1 Tax=Gaetbulibacter sp. NE TaxID=2982307 RepID=UPI0021CF8B80|nr:aminotransferase class IV [Gaetbulibacter sp. NE]